jgi:hypothetical protein
MKIEKNNRNCQTAHRYYAMVLVVYAVVEG